MVGRGDELARLGALLDEVRRGAGEGEDDGAAARFLAVSGEAGIGKTRLLDALEAAASDRGFLVLRGSAAEFERDVPFGLLVDALDPYLEALDPQAFERLQSDRLGELAGVFPALRDLAPAVEFPVTAAERFRAHHAARELLERLAVRKPLLLCLDDLHWADGASLELLMHLLRRPPQASVLVAVGFRSGRLEPGFGGALAAAAGDGALTRIELTPLSEEDAGALLGSPGGAAVAGLHHASGGNPFYLLELARHEGADQAASAAAVPGAVSRVIVDELDALDEAARSLAHAGAVAGAPFDLDLAAAVAALGDADALAAIDELVASGLIRPGSVPRRFEFRHPLVRHAVYESIPPGTRLAAHERCAAVLAAEGADVAARAHHVEQAARQGDEEAVAVLAEAARSVADTAPTSAARWLAAALRLLPAGADPFRRVELLTLLARSQGATGALAEARDSLDEAIGLLPSGMEAVSSPMVVGCAQIEQVLGDYDRAEARLRTALDALPAGAAAEAIALQIALATDRLYRADYEGMLDWARRAHMALEGAEDEAIQAGALAALAMAALCAGRLDHGLPALEEARDRIDTMPDEQLATWLPALSQLAGAEIHIDRYEEAVAHATRGLRLARETGQGEMVPELYPTMGIARFFTGDVSGAISYLDASVDGARLLGDERTLSWTLFNRAIGSLMLGDIEEARRTATDSAAASSRSDRGLIGGSVNGILAAIQLEAGDPAGALAALAAAGGEELDLLPGVWRIVYTELAVRVHIALGDLDAARATAGRLRELTSTLDAGLARLMAARGEANLALAEDRPADAAEAAMRAVAEGEAIKAVPELAITRELAGRALAAAGDTEGATRELKRAAADFEHLGGRRWRDRVERELRKLGHSVHRRSKPGTASADGIGSLTERELEVARLVVDRHTNREIAAELFLGIKTVETHMRNIFGKLGVSSRVEVARVVEGAGLSTAGGGHEPSGFPPAG